MTSIPRSQRYSVLVGFLIAAGANAQVSSINSTIVQSRVFNDITNAVFTGVNNYPTTISLTEAGVSQASGNLNRDVWRFSNDATTAYQFQPNDYFTVSMDLTLTGTPISPRKEAGLLFSTGSNGDIQFIVNTDGHEVVQFGGISFYSFSANNLVHYNSGDKITLGMTYFLDSNNKNALEFSANGIDSPVFGPGAGNGALDIGTGSTLGGYFQIANDTANASNGGSAVFQNISIGIPEVPEPSVFALLGVGSLAMLFRARRQPNRQVG
jgi:hypothetical protein